MTTKIHIMITFVFVLTLMQIHCSVAFLSWLFGPGKTDSSAAPTDENHENGVGGSFMTQLKTKNSMNFDLKTTDEKFISEMTVQEMKGLSPLDGCYHQVMTKLRKTCSNLNEEQVSKVAVQLLNCQLETEKRPTFRCDEDMSLSECTKTMDPTLWNSYQIVSNRARAVCYTIRQQQFRWKSEMAVNQLMYSTVEQLKAMKDIKEGQESVADATSSVLRKMYEGQQDLMSGHQTLKDAHNDVHKYVADNLKELTKEKALIATGNKELAELIDQIRTKMDEATHQLLEQHTDTQQNHGEVLKDLAEIRSKAREVWEKIDKSSRHVLQYHNETTEQYKRTLDNLQKVNNTINYVLSSVNTMQSGIDSKLRWLTEILGGTEDKLTLLSIGAIHTIYFLLAALSASFLQTPWITRLVVMVIVPLNAFSEMRQGVSLDFSAMTVFILFSSAASLFSQYLAKVTRPRLASIKRDGVSPPQSPFRCPHTSPTSPIFTPIVPPATEKLGLSDSDLKKLAKSLKGYMKNSRASSTCASTPLNLSRISCDSAIGTPHNFDDTTFNDSSKLDVTKEPAPSQVGPQEVEQVGVGMETTESISCLDSYVSEEMVTASKTGDLSMTAGTEADVTNGPFERTDISEIRPDLDIVRRQLMQSACVNNKTQNLNRSRPSSRTATPTRRSSRPSTPVRPDGGSATPVMGTPGRNTSRPSSRPGTPSKPFCQSLTNAGRPCKNRCTPGSEAFCRIHVMKNSDSKPVMNSMKDLSYLNTTQDFNETEINVTH